MVIGKGYGDLRREFIRRIKRLSNHLLGLALHPGCRISISRRKQTRPAPGHRHSGALIHFEIIYDGIGSSLISRLRSSVAWLPIVSMTSEFHTHKIFI